LDDLNFESIKNTSELMDIISKTYESYPAVYYGESVWSYSQLNQMIKSLATSMNDTFPLKKGQRVLVVLPPSVQSILAYFAMWRMGICTIPLSSKMPIEVIDKIVSSGKVSGIVTYDNLFSQINRDETTNIYNLLTDQKEFRSPFAKANWQMENYKNKGTRQRSIFEAMCFSVEGESVPIDVFTDYAIADIQWKVDGTFSFLNFSFRKVLLSLEKMYKDFALKENQTSIQLKEPSNTLEVISEILLPVCHGHKIMMPENKESKYIGKQLNTQGEEKGVVFWGDYELKEVLENIKSKYLKKISLIFSYYFWEDSELKFLKNKKSSVFSIQGNEGISIPIFYKQHLEMESIQSNISDQTSEEGQKIDANYMCHLYDSSEEDFDHIRTIQVNDKIVEKENGKDLFFHRGRTIPYYFIVKKLNSELISKDCTLSKESQDFRQLTVDITKAKSKKEFEKICKILPENLNHMVLRERNP
jgi:hypothetical protein